MEGKAEEILRLCWKSGPCLVLHLLFLHLISLPHRSKIKLHAYPQCTSSTKRGNSGKCGCLKPTPCFSRGDHKTTKLAPKLAIEAQRKSTQNAPSPSPPSCDWGPTLSNWKVRLRISDLRGLANNLFPFPVLNGGIHLQPEMSDVFSSFCLSFFLSFFLSSFHSSFLSFFIFFSVFLYTKQKQFLLVKHSTRFCSIQLENTTSFSKIKINNQFNTAQYKQGLVVWSLLEVNKTESPRLWWTW